MKVGKHEKLAIDKKHVPSHATLVSSTGHVTFVSAWHVDQIRMLVVKKINSVLRKLAAKNCREEWRQLRERESRMMIILSINKKQLRWTSNIR